MNLLGMLAMPAVATLAAVIMFGPRVDTMLAVFGLNAVPMLVGGLISALLLRGAGKAGGAGRGIALWPTLVPAGIGIVWYLWDALLPADLDPGRVHIAGPQYLLMIALLMGLISWIGCLVRRSTRAG
ncbi:MAG: hypothetical protein ACE5G3_06265 [Gammaproteobacteria bacterium]